MENSTLKVADVVFQSLDDLVDDATTAQAVLQIVAMLVQEKYTRIEQQRQIQQFMPPQGRSPILG